MQKMRIRLKTMDQGKEKVLGPVLISRSSKSGMIYLISPLRTRREKT